MGNFQGGGNRGGGFRGGNGGGGRPSFGGGRGGDRGEITMHKAVCDECQKGCEVPFRPSSDKPIYCNDCFGGKRGNEAPRRSFNDRGPKREFSDRPSSFQKPVSMPAGEDMKNLFREINVKLDRLTSAIEKLSQPKVFSQSSYVKPVAKVAPVITKTEVKKVPVAKITVKKVSTKAPIKKVIKKGKK